MSKLRRKVKLRQKFASFFSAEWPLRMLKASEGEAFKVSEIRKDPCVFGGPGGGA